MSTLAEATAFIEAASRTLPLIPFLFWASLLEELVAPIPAFFVAVVAAPLVHAEGYTYAGMGALALMSAVAKTIGTWIYYLIGDKAESVVTGKWGKALGLSHETIQGWGIKLGKGWKDEVVLTIVRIVPFFPSAPISVLAGVVKMPMRSFIGSSILGYGIRNMALLATAYEGLDWWKSWLGTAEAAGTSFTSFIVIGVILALAWFVWKGHHQTLAQQVIDFFRRGRGNSA